MSLRLHVDGKGHVLKTGYPCSLYFLRPQVIDYILLHYYYCDISCIFHFRCVLFLLEYGALPQMADQQNWTALHLAASEGHTECCKLLLDHGGQLSATSTVCTTCFELGFIIKHKNKEKHN